MPATEVNKDLQNERQKCTFKNEEFTLWWVGGEAKLKEKRFRGELHYMMVPRPAYMIKHFWRPVDGHFMTEFYSYYII